MAAPRNISPIIVDFAGREMFRITSPVARIANIVRRRRVIALIRHIDLLNDQAANVVGDHARRRRDDGTPIDASTRRHRNFL